MAGPARAERVDLETDRDFLRSLMAESHHRQFLVLRPAAWFLGKSLPPRKEPVSGGLHTSLWPALLRSEDRAGASGPQRSLVGYSSWGHKELDMTEQVSTSFYYAHSFWDQKSEKADLCLHRPTGGGQREELRPWQRS